MKWEGRSAATTLSLRTTVVRVLVGKGAEQREFDVHRKLLYTASGYFREYLDQKSPSSHAPVEPGSPSDILQVIFLPEESPSMFDMFICWLYQQRKFREYINDAIHNLAPDAVSAADPHDDGSRRTLHKNLINLHLFAALVEIPVLQDLCMDAIQDMYLRCDWDIRPHFMSWLYGSCHPEQSIRLRKWGVAMVAWALNGSQAEQLWRYRFEELFVLYPELEADYCAHLEKMRESKADVRLKNPQLRLPRNRLRNEERFFGFRQCSFHSHRSTVGEGVCVHVLSAPHTAPSPWMQADADVKDASATVDILSPVFEHVARCSDFI